jgi:predicted component of type VI protein secretion system
MAAAPAQNTVTLAVTVGESANPTATFSAAMAARMITVGSGANAHWKVRAPGVEALHAEIYWDGAALWVRNGGSVSGTYVNGARADDWAQVFDGAEIALGRAKITAKATGAGARNPAGTDPRITAASAGYMAEEESTMVFSGAKLAAAGASIPPPVAPQPPLPQNARGRAGTLAPPVPSGMAAPIAPSRPPIAPPDPPSEPDPPKPPASEATVIRASPYAALLEGPGAMAPLPAAGNRNPMPGAQHTIAPGSLQTGGGGSVLVSPSAVSLPVVAPARAGTMGGIQALQPVQPSPGSGMSQPGVSQPGAWGDDPFGPMDLPPPPSAAAEKTVAGTSPRTLILGGVTLVIGLIAAILPPPQQAPRGRAAGPTAEVQTRGAPAPATNNILQLPISPPGLVGVIVPAPMTSTDPQGRPRGLPPPNANDPIKLAAEAVAANRYADAAVLYERLATEHPEAPLFRQFALVLRQRLAMMNCPPGAPGCNPSPTPAPTTQPSQAAQRSP